MEMERFGRALLADRPGSYPWVASDGRMTNDMRPLPGRRELATRAVPGEVEPRGLPYRKGSVPRAQRRPSRLASQCAV